MAFGIFFQFLGASLPLILFFTSYPLTWNSVGIILLFDGPLLALGNVSPLSRCPLPAIVVLDILYPAW